MKARGGAACVAAAAWAFAAAGCIERPADADGGDPGGMDGGWERDGAPGYDAAATDAGPPAPLCMLGQGEDEFVDAPNGAGVEVQQGGQGGRHLWLSVRVSGLDPGNPLLPNSPTNPLVRIVTTDEIGAVLSDITLQVGFRAVAGLAGVYEILSWTEYLSICACAVVTGETLTVTVTVTDAAGVVATDARTWVAYDSPDCTPPAADCIF
jgi:hypothetical protein